MRIRKNAKTSAFLPTNSPSISNNHQPTLCLLNQSPWDIITFPPAHSSSTSMIHLFDDFVTCYNVNLPANWSSTDSDRAIQSVVLTKDSFECEYDIVNRNQNVDVKIKNYELYQEDDELGFMKECVKKEDNLVDPQNDAVWSTYKKAQPHGTKKRAVGITPKQNEFYYYSGFGPTWGKKRGGVGDKCTTFNARGTTSGRSSVCEPSGGVGDIDVEDEGLAGPDTTMLQAVWSCQVTPEGEDFGYVGEDVRDDGKQKEKTVKKRGRKPIKARSLKSLM